MEHYYVKTNQLMRYQAGYQAKAKEDEAAFKAYEEKLAGCDATIAELRAALQAAKQTK